MKMHFSTLCLGLLFVVSSSLAQPHPSLIEREITEGKIAAVENDSLATQIKGERLKIQTLFKEINSVHDRITLRVMDSQESASSDEESLMASPIRCSGQILFISEDVIRGLRSAKKTSDGETLVRFQNAKTELQKNFLSMQDCEKM